MKNNKTYINKFIILIFLLSYPKIFAETLQISENGIYGKFKDMDVAISGSAEIHLTDTPPFENASINILGNEALLFFDCIKPSVVEADYLKYIAIDGEAADINKNVRVELYRNGAVIIPHGYKELSDALTVYSEPDCAGAERKFAVHEKDGDLGSFDNNIRSFRLKRGFQVCFANNPDGTGHSRIYIADKDELVVNELPDGFVTKDGTGRSFISFVKVERHHWTEKKIANSIYEAPLMNASSYFNYFLSEKDYGATDYECVYNCENNSREHTAKEVRDLTRISVIMGDYLPDFSTFPETTSPEQAVRSWPGMFTAGVRTGAPSGYEKTWNKRFFEMIDSLNYRVDFARLYHKFKNSEELESDIDYLLSVGNKRPVWINEITFAGEPFTDTYSQDATTEEEIFSQSADLLKQTLQIFDRNPKIERFRIAGLKKDDDLTVLTPLGEVYRDFETGMSFSAANQYEHLWHIAPPLPLLSLSKDRKTLRLSWYDHNGETGKGYKIYCRDTDLGGATEEWKEIGEKILGKDYNPGDDVMAEYAVDMKFLREYRIKAISYMDEESGFSRIVPVTRDSISGEFYLEAVYPVESYRVSMRWSVAAGAPGYVIECKESDSDKWEILGQTENTTSYITSKVVPGKTYTFRVKTFSNADDEITSNEITVTTREIIKPTEEITGVHAAEGDGIVTLSWNKTKAGIDVERSDEQGVKIKIAEGVKDNFYSDSGLRNNTVYTYYLSPAQTQGADAKTTVISATPRPDNFIHIPFNDGCGLIAKDNHGGQHAEISGCFKWERDENGEFNAITLNSGYHSYISVPIDKFIGLGEYTMSLQFTIPHGEEGPVFYFGDKYITGGYIGLNYSQEKPDVLCLELCSDSSEPAVRDKNAVCYDLPCQADHKNIHFILTRDGEDLKIYIDGKPGLAINNLGFPPVYKGNTLFNLGMTQRGYNPYMESLWNEKYSSFTFWNLRIYNKALSEEEIEQLKETDAIEEINPESDMPGLIVKGGKGWIKISTEAAGAANIYSIDGRLIRTINLPAGGNYEFNNMSPGIYIVGKTKILVK